MRKSLNYGGITRGGPNTASATTVRSNSARPIGSARQSAPPPLSSRPLPSSANGQITTPTIPANNELLMRVQRRGGLWGCRALRLAFAKHLNIYRECISTSPSTFPSIPHPTAIPLLLAMDAFHEYGLKDITAVYVLHWLSPTVLKATAGVAVVSSTSGSSMGGASKIGGGNTNSIETASSVTAEQFSTPVMMYSDGLTPPKHASAMPITAVLRPQKSSQQYQFKAINSKTPSAATFDNIEKYRTYFLDFPKFLRLLGCWLPTPRLQVIQACFTLLSEKLGRHSTQNENASTSISRGRATGVAIPALGRTAQGDGGLILTLRDLFTHLDITKHADCTAALVRKADALVCLYHLWGVQDLNARISIELFSQFHADFCVAYTDAQFSALFPALWGFSATEIHSVAPPPLPLRRSDANTLFETIDSNKNGILSLAELDSAIVNRFPQYNYKPLIMRAYKLADKNRSGHISRNEFFAFMVYISHMVKFSQLFEKIDTDRSKSLTLKELTDGKAVLGLEDAPNSRLRALFMEIDKNKQGKILFNEFCDALLKCYPPPELLD